MHAYPPLERAQTRRAAFEHITIVLADDHRLMREGVRRILEGRPDLHILGEAQSGHDLLKLLQTHPARVAVVDLNMRGMPGMTLIERIRREHPETAVLVLTMHSEEQYALRAFRAGASGFLTKDSAAEELVTALAKVAAGGVYLSQSMAERVAFSLSHHSDAPRHELLSDRELEVFRLIVAGERMTDIASTLHLSIKTVSTHKARILEKMQLDSTAALIRYGLQHKLFAELAPSP